MWECKKKKKKKKVHFLILGLTYKEDDDRGCQPAATSGIYATNSHDPRGGWSCRKCFMPSHWQLDVECCFAKAVCGTGEEKEPCFTSVQVQISLIDSCRYICGVKSTVMLMQNKGNNLTGGKCWFRPHVLSARKDVSVTSRTDATWRNGRWKAHFLCDLSRFLCVCSHRRHTQLSCYKHTHTESLKADKQILLSVS